MRARTSIRYFAAIAVLVSLTQLAYGQAAIVSEREKIVTYDATNLNPEEPG